MSTPSHASRWPILLGCIALTGILAVPTARAENAAPADRPNILFIMSDDHAAHAIGAYGSRLAALNPTPTLDTLAREGMLFENCFVTNSICVPSRACIMTGQYNHVNRAYTLSESIEPARQHLAIEMRKAGYQTAMIGKWHLTKEPAAFDHYCVLPGQGKYHDPVFRQKGQGDWPKNEIQASGHSSDRITDITLKWLSQRDTSRPFFLMHHYKAPHDFFDHAHRYDDYLADVDIPEPENLWRQERFGSIATRGHNDELLPFIGTSIGRRHTFRNYTRNWANDAALTDEQAKRLAYNEYMKRYLRCVKGVDDNLRRLFDYLKTEGLYDNTVILYTGDQGMMLGEHDYQDKRWMYDESQRMPLLVRYPKTIKPGTRSDAIVENVDFGPAMLDFAGVETPEYMQGRSFRSICETGAAPDDWRDAAYYRYWMHLAHHWNPSHFGIRTKQFKLIFYYGCDMQGGNRTPPGWELYDLENDPHEVNNVYDDPQYAEVVGRLKQRLRQRRAEVGDTDEQFPAVRAIVDEFWDYDEADRSRAIEMSHQYAAAQRALIERRAKPKTSAKIERLEGGWIKPAASTAPLRTHRGHREISRDADYRVDKPGPTAFNVDNAYLVSGDAPPVKPHAFHSPIDAEQPFVVIRLAAPSRVRAIHVVNRADSLHERAAGLTAWVSDNERDWRPLWQAEKAAAQWWIESGDDVTCRYIKLGLPGRGTLHLNHVTVFGEAADANP